MYKAAIITASDKGAAGEREDLSGKLIAQILSDKGLDVVYKTIVPDDIDLIRKALLASTKIADIVFTTGGTGFSTRDVTPEATRLVIEKECNGVTAAIVANGLQHTPRAMLSRAVCGIKGKTVILNLPGSPKAVSETLSFVLDSLLHGLDILNGGGECAR